MTKEENLTRFITALKPSRLTVTSLLTLRHLMTQTTITIDGTNYLLTIQRADEASAEGTIKQAQEAGRAETAALARPALLEKMEAKKMTTVARSQIAAAAQRANAKAKQDGNEALTAHIKAIIAEAAGIQGGKIKDVPNDKLAELYERLNNL